MFNFLIIIKKLIFRISRIITFRKGIYGKIGVKNHFAQGVLLYEYAKIGSYNYFAPYTLVNNAVIGNYCSIGPSCKIGLANHHIHAISTSSFIKEKEFPKQLFDIHNPTVIDNDVWLGANVVIKQGVHIGNGAVIGANAVVTHNIPPYAIVVGIPGKIIAYRFSDEKITFYQESQWFAKEPKEANRLVEMIKQHLQS